MLKHYQTLFYQALLSKATFSGFIIYVTIRSCVFIEIIVVMSIFSRDIFLLNKSTETKLIDFGEYLFWFVYLQINVEKIIILIYLLF